jgi:hypothetical protein
MAITRLRPSPILVMVLIVVLAFTPLFTLQQVSFAKHLSNNSDDLFGLFYDGGNVPSSAQGIRISFSSSTTGITFDNSSGSVADCEMVTLTSGSNPYRLEPCVSIFPQSGTCSSHGISANCWDISLGWWDSSGGHPDNVAYISASTYPSISGTIEGYYTGSQWEDVVYISQTNNVYTYNPPVCSSTCQYVYGGNNDWTSVETSPNQSGDDFSSSFAWTLTNPQFLESGIWYGYNSQVSGSDVLTAKVAWQPGLSNNTLSTSQLTSTINPGVEVYEYGSNPTNQNGNTWTWSWSPVTAFVQSGWGHNSCSTTCSSSFGLTLSSSVTSGDLLEVAVGTYATGGSFSVTDTIKNSWSSAITACVNDCVQIFYTTSKFTGTDTITISTSYSSTYTYAFTIEISHTSGSVDKTSYCPSSCSGNPSVTSFTPVTGAAVVDIAAGESSWSNVSPYNMIGTNTLWSAASEYAMDWNSGSTTAPWTASGGTLGEVAVSFVPT